MKCIQHYSRFPIATCQTWQRAMRAGDWGEEALWLRDFDVSDAKRKANTKSEVMGRPSDGKMRDWGPEHVVWWDQHFPCSGTSRGYASASRELQRGSTDEVILLLSDPRSLAAKENYPISFNSNEPFTRFDLPRFQTMDAIIKVWFLCFCIYEICIGLACSSMRKWRYYWSITEFYNITFYEYYSITGITEWVQKITCVLSIWMNNLFLKIILTENKWITFIQIINYSS